jgi:ubiquitin-protein ligase
MVPWCSQILFQLPWDYPFKPPAVQLLTPVLHPCVRPDGSVIEHRGSL